MLTSRGVRRAGQAVLAAVLLTAVTACDKAATSSTPAAPVTVNLYGTDGNMINSFGDEFKDAAGMLSGMKGTTPMTPLTDDFKRRLREAAPGLGDFVYAGETYDAVVISALAAQLAGSTNPQAIAQQINAVTTGGDDCDTVKTCLLLARGGRDIAYRGISLTRGGFTDAGEPSTASYATLHFGSTDRLDDGKTEYVGAGDPSATTKKRAPAPVKDDPGSPADTRDGSPLVFGGLLPKTGDLALAYPPLAAGAALAIKEINDAGGVLGDPVVWKFGDDGTDPKVAKRTVQAHIEAGVQVIIGAGASGISRAVLPDVVKAGLILFSPCNTDAGLTMIGDKGLYFRTAPSDVLQGKALADVVLRDGPEKITIVARKDSYGEGLEENTRSELVKAGFPADRLQLMTYVPPEKGTLDCSTGAQEIKSFRPDAVVVIGFGESAQVIKGLVKAGVELRH
jgi:ABC-type branched-subunit amino acid transport system substrate-binding protein